MSWSDELPNDNITNFLGVLANLAVLQSSAKDPLEVLIVGAGLGGISAAISIALSGHSVRVLEAAKELAEVRDAFIETLSMGFTSENI